MEKFTPEQERLIHEVSDRVSELARRNLDPAIWAILQILNRQTEFTDVQLRLLAWAERYYGVRRNDN